MKTKKYFILLFLLWSAIAQGQTTKTVGSSGADYTTLKLAFDAINSGAITGAITLQIVNGTTETASAVLNASGSGSASYTSVTIYPTVTGKTISGNIAAPLIDLNGADNVTIDGRLNATGTAIDLTIINQNTSDVDHTTTIRFTNSAENNTIQYCSLKGAAKSDEVGTNSGIVTFLQVTTGNGNDNNMIDYCSFTGVSATDRPTNGIYCKGFSVAVLNNNITISNSIFFDLWRTDATSFAINVSNFNSTLNITGNNIFETTTIVPTIACDYNGIVVNSANGNNFNISNNHIGGVQANCGGTKMTINGSSFSNRFYGISLSAGTVTSSTISGNDITNIQITSNIALNNYPWTGINVGAGSVNISENTIGSATGTEAVISSSSVASQIASSYGIYINSSGVVGLLDNTIGSIKTIASATHAHYFYGIYIASSSSATLNISNNLVGSESASNSIQTSTAATSFQLLYGIHNLGSGTSNISNNTIANLHNAYNGTENQARATGIYTRYGIFSITDNTVRNISSASTQPYVAGAASVFGIQNAATTQNGQSITGNQVHNLSNTQTGNVKSYVCGIYYQGPVAGTNQISRNFIHSLSLNATSAIGLTSLIEGISINNGMSIVDNNIISLGTSITSGYAVNGIAVNTSGSNIKLYFNTVYVGGGSVTGITQNTYALYDYSSTVTRDYRNNILFNARSGGTTGKHYSIRITAATNLTIDFNDYWTSGSNGILGYFETDKTTITDWRAVTGQDANSFNINPGFTNAGGTGATDYITSAALPAVAGTGILTDYAGVTRSAPPKMGAFENNSFIWSGNINTNWNTGGNWSGGAVPGTADNAVVLDATNDPVINEDPGTPASCNDLTITSGVLTIAPGKALTVNGTLTNNAGTTGLVIQSESDASTGTGSLKNNTAGVSATVERWMTGDIWHLISPTATGQIAASFVGDAANSIAFKSNLRFGLAPYNESNNTWKYFAHPTTEGSLDVVGKGYQVLRATGAGTGQGNAAYDGKVSFKGTLAAATNLSIGITKNSFGWNLIGNPYPCAMNVAAFIATNSGVIDPSFQAIYVSTISDIVTYGYQPHSADPAVTNLASGEAFFVKSKNSTGTINFTTAMKSHTSDAFKSAVIQNGFNLIAETAGIKMNTSVKYIPQMTAGLDPGWDLGLFDNGDDVPLSLFTHLVEDNGVDFTIQCLPDFDYENLVVPVGITAKQDATIEFSLADVTVPVDYKVFLEDKLNGKFTRLDEQGSVYTVQINTASNGTGRFFLHTKQEITGIKDGLSNNIEVIPLPQHSIIRVSGLVNLPAQATVYDMNGRMITIKKLTSLNENDIPLQGVSNGIYLVKIKSDKQTTQCKFSWSL